MNQEPTLAQLEDQEPQSQEDIESQIRQLNDDLGGVRIILRMSRKEEVQLMTKRAWLRTQLQMLRLPNITIPAEVATDETPVPDGHFNGTTQPECPDCTMDDM
jgi:hypothetical protein